MSAPFFIFDPVNENYINEAALEQLITSAFSEDIGEGDHSTLASVPSTATDCAVVIMKEAGVIAGIELAQRIMRRLDPNMQITVLAKDGQKVEIGQPILRLEGNARVLLSGERLMLNCLQRMSGIATFTQKAVSLLEGLPVKLLDTRKTTPNFRLLEKWAVAIGGGTNHRFGLYDMIMLKDNHIDFAGGISAAIRATAEYLERTGKLLKVEIETRTLDEVKQVLQEGKVDIIMLDNMSLAQMREAVNLIGKRYQTEASGGIRLEGLREIAETGVDFISMGALTHSAKSLDISMKACSALK